MPGPSLDAERRRATARRAALGLQRPGWPDDAQWALALSGGGIRSATFCLGVLQGLARRPGPPGSADAHSLLRQFDTLSTVSGGGYIGAFVSSLAVPGRLTGDPGESDATAAAHAQDVLREEPPARMHTDTHFDPDHPGRAALAWLRDNGRYLAPSGAGDVLYATAMALRNWMAMHYVGATAAAALMALVLVVRWGLVATVPAVAALEQSLLDRALGVDARPPLGLWISLLAALCLPVLLLGALPLGAAYWYTHAGATDPASDCPRGLPPGLWAALLIGGTSAALLAWRLGAEGVRADSPVQITLLAGSVAVVASMLWYWLTRLWSGCPTIAEQRVMLTRALTHSLELLLALAVAAVVDTLAQTVLLYRHHAASWAWSGPGLAVAVWLLRALAQWGAEKQAPAWLKRLPVGGLALVGAGLLWLVAAVAAQTLLHWIVWDAWDPTSTPMAAAAPAVFVRSLFALLAGVLLAGAVARFPGFLNLSTFQVFYSARLVRAYLGASNHRRFGTSGPRGEQLRRHSVAEPIEGDGLALGEIHRNPLAPVHLINVCVNQTVGPGEQLVQRDRKGKPLVVAPGGFYLDGEPHAFPEPPHTRLRSEIDLPLTLGEWTGVSGAAFTTGLGRATTLGMSLLLGFANVRLGRWWRSGAGASRSDAAAPRDPWLRRTFPTQTYLLDELLGRFYGTHRQLQYLSDGGHFENTGAYELLRRERGVRLIVMADCGADPDYAFDDLANLIRLARIDHGLEMRLHDAVLADPDLAGVFGRPEDFRDDADAASPPCALLFDVFDARADGRLTARLLVLKPARIAALPADVANYQRRHADFPQESTGDQFYDEAQWESYRKLGLAVAERVFPADVHSPQAQALWRALA